MADGIRQRKEAGRPDAESRRETAKRSDEDEPAITIVDGMRIIVGILLLNCLLSYFITGDSVVWGYNPWWIRPKVWMQRMRPPVTLTDSELLAYAGHNASLPIYLGLNGTIYDVTAGRRIYGPGGSYNHFAGRDATRGFITGCFQEDAVPDYRGAEWTFIPTDVPRFVDQRDEDLDAEARAYRYEMLEQAHKQVDETVQGWAKMFRGEGGKDYFEVGKIQRKRRWMEREPLRPLCEAAERGRPKPKSQRKSKSELVDAGAKYRGA